MLDLAGHSIRESKQHNVQLTHIHKLYVPFPAPIPHARTLSPFSLSLLNLSAHRASSVFELKACDGSGHFPRM